MRSATSYFNKTVFQNDLKRFWPLWAGYALIWLLLLPLNLLTDFQHQSWYYYESLANRALPAQADALNVAVGGGWIMAFIFGILFAMAVFSYLTSPRATNGIHALSARRETLYVTHYLAGLCCQFSAQLAAAVLAFAVLAANGCGSARILGLSLLGMLLPTLLFYSFGVLCMIFTGQILAAPVFYGILNVLAVAMEYLVYQFAGNFLYGWADSFDGRLKYLSPIVLFAYGAGPSAGYLYEEFRRADGTLYEDPYAVTIDGWQLLAIYALVGLIFAALGLLLYRKRHSEATGTTVAIYWARPIFKYGVTFCTAFALGQLLYFLFFGRYRANGDYSLGGTVACMAAAGLIGYFAAEMLLKKSFRVLRSGWKGAVVVTALLVAFGFGMSLDPTGFEGYVPDPAQVESAVVYLDIYGYGSSARFNASDPRTLALTLDAHRALVNDRQRQQESYRRELEPDRDGEIVSGRFEVVYTLRSGRVVRRAYNPIVLRASDLGDPASPAATLNALYTTDEATLRRALGSGWSYSDVDFRKLDLRFTGGYFYTDYGEQSETSEWRYYHQERELTAAEAKTIYEAILRDVEAGHIPDSVFDASWPWTNGSLELYATYPEDGKPRAAAQTLRAPDPEEGRVTVVFRPDLRESMTYTVAALKDMGLEPYFWD